MSTVPIVEEKGPLKVLITAMMSIGHLNACLGVASIISKRGHQVYFAHYPDNRATIEKQGFHFISIPDYADEKYPMMDRLPKDINKFMKPRFEKAMKYTPLEALKEELACEGNMGFIMLLNSAKGENYATQKIIEEIQPDVCLADYLFPLPWMFSVKCPAIPVWSASPIYLYDGPPMTSGYSVHDSPDLWKEYRSLQEQNEMDVEIKLKELFQFYNVEYKSRTYVKQLGIYIYPGPLDYKELGQPKYNWVRLDASIRQSEFADLSIPEKIKDKPGKLIYVSMGTLASSVTELMEMVITPLAKCPHRFIVSTGVFGDKIKLSDNMWGDKFINQLALLPKVDLFITHGGSNSLIEGLAAGVPLIIIPLFGDQPDNGQRIVDLRLGAKINLWDFSDDKLLKAIDDVLGNEEIYSNVARISAELKKSDSSDKVVSLIEQLARNNQSI